MAVSEHPVTVFPQLCCTLRYKRQQLVKLQEADQPTHVYWVDSQELAGNAHCLILAQDPRQFEEFQGPQTRRRANLSKAPRTLLFTLDSPEPTEVRGGFSSTAPLRGHAVCSLLFLKRLACLASL